MRSELFKQRKAGQRTTRNAVKRAHGGRSADYRHIYSQNSLKKHLSRVNHFAEYAKQNGIKNLNQLTPEVAKNYLIWERDQHVRGYSGYSASTIASDALMLNHVMIGGNYWKTAQKLEKSHIAGMPKRSTILAKQRQKKIASDEWRKMYPHTYSTYKAQIDTLRAFGLRRRELTGGTAKNRSDGLGTHSIFEYRGRLWVHTQGKGGKIRWAQCRKDLEPEMRRLYADNVRPLKHFPSTPKADKDMFNHDLKLNKQFYTGYAHSTPSHIFRAEYAQKKLLELNQRQYTGYRDKIGYKRIGVKPDGRPKWGRYTKKNGISLHSTYKIGAYTAQRGAFYTLSKMMGHNRLDVLQSYLGEGR